MGILDGLKGMFGGGGGSAAGSADGFFFYIRCRRGHPIRLWVNRGYDLIRTFAGSDEHEGFLLNKSIVCPTCFQQARVVIRYDERHHELDREIENGAFITAAEYEADAPAEADEPRE